ncbi:linker for activation of T-cells family member 1 isoform X3 [Marmota flaviventris]|uniref:linker for activation of T-cells family member 1 isoform X3 n=1 Tax=Marmota flaviventris TaxID=93162 RepID=UPI003A894E32
MPCPYLRAPVAPQASSPFPQLGGGGWGRVQLAEEPDDFLPSPGAHHSFLLRVAGQAGVEERQALSRGAGTPGAQGPHRVTGAPDHSPGPGPPRTRVSEPAPSPTQSSKGRWSRSPRGGHSCSPGPPVGGPLGPYTPLQLSERGLWGSRPGTGALLQMEVDGLTPYPLGLLLLPLLAMLLIALCVRCHEPPDSYDSAPADSSNPTSILIKPPYTPVPWPPAASYPPVISYPPPSQPDLLPIPRSPQPPVGSHRMPPSQQDSDGANSMASYENQEPACEDADEDDDEDDYHNPGYLMVLPDSTPATSTAAPSAPVPSDPGLRDSTFSMEDYVNVPESGESAEASLDGSREYVNVSQELESEAPVKPVPAPLSSQEVGDEEEEGLPDYENLQELN